VTRDQLIAEYRKQAALGQFQGLTVLNYESQLHKLCNRFNAKTILDYGSGHGKAWSGGLQLRLGLTDVRRYDPAIPAFSDKPAAGEKFDGVVCCDVLEHMLREDVEQAIDDLFRYATKFVFATVCCRPAKKLFPDLTNMHVTIMPIDEWEALFRRKSCEIPGPAWLLVETS
jgi:hypothetical protein